MNHINNNHAQLFLQQYMQTSLYSIKLGPVGIIPSLSPPRRSDTRVRESERVEIKGW